MKYIAITLMVVSGLSFAFEMNDAGKFEGGGKWKSATGEKGTWKSTMEIASAKEKEFTVKETLEVYKADGTQEHVENSESTIVVKDHGFYDITMDGKVVGSGSCIAKKCTSLFQDFEGKKGMSHETFAMRKENIVRTGSMLGDINVTWHGVMKKAVIAPQPAPVPQPGPGTQG